MKKSILQFSVIAAIAASMTLTTSCSSDESVAEAYVPEPVQFGIDLGDMTLARATTRNQSASTATDWTASIDGKFAVNDIVYIWTTDADGNFYRKAYKVETAASAVEQSNTLKPYNTDATSQFYWKNTTERKRYEIYSFGKSSLDSTNIKASERTYTTPQPASFESVPASYIYTVPADQSDDTEKTEFLFGYGTIYYAASTVAKELKVSHQLARIDVKVITDKNSVNVTKKVDFISGTDDEYDPVKSAQTTESFDLKIGSSDTQLKGKFTAPPFPSSPSPVTADEIKGEKTDVGSWSTEASAVVSQEKGQITPRVLIEQRYNETSKKYETNYSAVVMPQTVAEDADWFTIRYDGATYKYKIPSGGFTIQPGKKYVYTVTFEDTNINVSVAIQEWQDGFPSGEGSVTAELQGS